MKKLLTRLFTVLLSITVLTVVGLGDATASTTRLASPAQQSSASPIHGHARGTAHNGSTFSGRFTPARFVQRPHRVMAVGKLTGTLTRASGRTSPVDQKIRLRVTKADFLGKPVPNASSAQSNAAAAGSCQILDLVLGPLDLDLLGLQVHLNRVHLNITAQTGPGNLLGNLLCAIAGLLDGTPLSSLLSQLANVLNQILAALGG